MLWRCDKRRALILVVMDLNGGLPAEVEISWKEFKIIQEVDYLHIHFRCFGCGQIGHLWAACTSPSLRDEGRSMHVKLAAKDGGQTHGVNSGTSKIQHCQTSVPLEGQHSPTDRCLESLLGKLKTNSLLIYDDLSKEEIYFIEELEKSSVLKHLGPTIDKGKSDTVINPIDRSLLVDLCDSVPTSPVLPSNPVPLLDFSFETPIVQASSVNPSTNEPVTSHSTPLTSYHDMLLAHLPIYSDKSSDKHGVSPIGSFHCQNVTIRRKKGVRKKGEIPSLDPGRV